MLQALNMVSRAIATKSHLPILSGVRLEVTMESCTITASNIEIAIDSVVKGEKITVIDPGSTVIIARSLLEII